MRFVTIAIVPLFACATAVAAVAQTTSKPATPTNSDLDQVVCHTMAAPTGTRLGAHHECHTQREWDAQELREQQEIEKAQQIGLTGGVTGH
jgi:hypothetical protein